MLFHQPVEEIAGDESDDDCWEKLTDSDVYAIHLTPPRKTMALH
jgi:hypothetical protein